jgi:Reverse transcriptase (RNA-dependent DNA polymerase)
MIVLQERLKAQLEPHLTDEQAGFRKDRSTTHQILILRLIAEKAKRKGRHILNCFIDFRKAFDSIKHYVT